MVHSQNLKITGIDSYNPCIIKVQSRKLPDTIDFFCADFLEYSFCDKFDAIIFVASIHHMDMRQALIKAKSLLNENGLLLIVGLGKPSSLFDFFIEAMRIIPSFIITKIKKIHSCEDENVPVSYNFPTMKEIRTIKKELLNDSKIKYGLFYRYLIKWEKV